MKQRRYIHAFILLLVTEGQSFAEQVDVPSTIKFEDAYSVKNEEIYNDIVNSAWIESEGSKEISVLSFDLHERTVLVNCNLSPQQGQKKSCSLVTGATVSGDQPRNGFRNFGWRSFDPKVVKQLSEMKWIEENQEDNTFRILSTNGSWFKDRDDASHFVIKCSKKDLACYYKVEILVKE